MSIDRGMSVTDLVARIGVDLSDTNQRRWTADQKVRFINEALRELASDGAFVRDDLQVPTANKAYYPTFAESDRIVSAEYNFKPLRPTTREWLHTNKGPGWQDDTGTPEYYFSDREGVRLYPIPDTAGTALTFTGSPEIDETEGGKINGDGYTGADNSGTIAHFKTGDGEVSNADTAENNLRIRYRFVPRPSTSEDSIQSRYEDALAAFVIWRCFSLSQVPEEVARTQALYPHWLRLKNSIVSSSGEWTQSEGNMFAPMEST